MYRKDLLIIFIVIFFLGIIIFGGLQYIATIQHEDVHRQIDTYFGCDNVTVSLSFWDTSYTQCNDINRTVSAQEWSLHAYNEIVTYNNSHITVSIFFCTMLLIVFLFIMFIHIMD